MYNNFKCKRSTSYSHFLGVRFFHESSIRLYPKSSSEDSNDKQLKSHHDKIMQHVSDLKDRETGSIKNLRNKAYYDFSKCNSINELDRAKQDIKQEQMLTSAQYIREVRDYQRALEEKQGFADKPQDTRKQQNDLELNRLINEQGRTLKNHLNAIEEEYSEIKKHKFDDNGNRHYHPENNDSNSSGSDLDKSGISKAPLQGEFDTDKYIKGKNNQSNIEYVL